MLTRKNFIIFALLLLVATLALEQYTDWDMLIIRRFYNSANKEWMINLYEHYALSPFFYNGLKSFVAACGTLSALTIAASIKYPGLRSYIPGCLILLLSTIIIPTLIGQIKSLTNIYCPNLLLDFNGFVTYRHVFEILPPDASFPHPGRCFPASHPSGPFALMSAYFIFKDRPNRLFAVYLAFTLGIIASFYQMMRGEHFLSHCLVSFSVAVIGIICIEKTVKFILSYISPYNHRSRHNQTCIILNME